MSDERWTVLREQTLFDRQPWLRLIEQDVQLPDGRVIEGYLKANAPPYTSVFALTENNLVVTIEEYKHGPGRVVLKLPAGFIEPDESALEGAKRELLEESGYEASEWRLLGQFYDDGNRGMSLGYHYLAQGLRKVAEPSAGDLATVKPGLMTAAALRQALLAGEVGESATAVGMLLGLDALQNGV